MSFSKTASKKPPSAETCTGSPWLFATKITNECQKISFGITGTLWLSIWQGKRSSARLQIVCVKLLKSSLVLRRLVFCCPKRPLNSNRTCNPIQNSLSSPNQILAKVVKEFFLLISLSRYPRIYGKTSTQTF